MVIHLPGLPDPCKGLQVLIRAAPVMKRFIKVMGSVFPEHPGKAICFQDNYSSLEGLLIPVAKSQDHAVRGPARPCQPPPCCSLYFHWHSLSTLWGSALMPRPREAIFVLPRLGGLMVSETPTPCCPPCCPKDLSLDNKYLLKVGEVCLLPQR